jgi:hypothetical protein
MGFLTEMNRLPLIFLSLLNEETGRPGLIICVIFTDKRATALTVFILIIVITYHSRNRCALKADEMCRFFERLNGCISQVFLGDAESCTTTPRE